MTNNLYFSFCPLTPERTFYSPANPNSSSRDISANSSRFCVVLLYLENLLFYYIYASDYIELYMTINFVY